MQADLRLDGSRVVVRSRYSAVLVDRFRTIPGRQYHADTKSWSFPCVKDVLLMVTDACGILPEMLPLEIRKMIGYQTPIIGQPDLSVLDGHPWKTTPYEHQRVNLARLLANNRWLIADEQGAGKTFVICNLLRRMTLAKTLILCPKSVIDVWKRELDEHADLECAIIDGTPIHRRQLLSYQQPKIKVANYEKLLHSFEDFRKQQWDILVMDEVHRAKSLTSETCKACRQLSSQTPFVYGLSGTPAPNGLEDWLGVLEAVAPGYLPCKGARGENTKSEFEARYCLKEQLGGNGPFIVTGYRNVAELHGYVAGITSRVTKAECLDLPPKVYSSRYVTLDGEQASVYRQVKKDAVAVLKEMGRQGTLTVRNILTESLRLLQIVGGFATADDETVYELPEKAKMAALMEVLDEIGDKQVIIWCRFLPEVEWLAKKLADRGEVSVLQGSSTDRERKEAVDRFQAGDSRFFIGTSAGGEGITLTAADTEIFYSRDYNLKNFLQQTDRPHRIGQTRTVSVIKLIASKTVDVRIDEKLDQKADLQEMLLQKPEDYL